MKQVGSFIVGGICGYMFILLISVIINFYNDDSSPAPSTKSNKTVQTEKVVTFKPTKFKDIIMQCAAYNMAAYIYGGQTDSLQFNMDATVKNYTEMKTRFGIATEYDHEMAVYIKDIVRIITQGNTLDLKPIINKCATIKYINAVVSMKTASSIM